MPPLHPAHAENRQATARDVADLLWDRILHESSKSDPLTVRTYLHADARYQQALRRLAGHPDSKSSETWRMAIGIVQDRIEARIGTRFRWHSGIPVTSPDPSSPDGVALHGHRPCDLCGRSEAVLTVGRFAPLEVCASGCRLEAVEMATEADVVGREFEPAVAAAAEVVDTRGHQEARV